MAGKEKSLLYVSPTIPAPGGNGRAMRAYNVLQGLSCHYQVHLLIVSREVCQGRHYRLDPKIADLCETIECVPIDPLTDLQMLIRVRLFKLSRRWYYRLFPSIADLYCSPQMMRTLESLYQGRRFDIVHVFRIYMIELAKCCLSSEANPTLQVDFDDIESRTHHRLENLYLLNHEDGKARSMRLDGESYQELEGKMLAEADRIFVCSSEDKFWLTDKYGSSNIHVLHNIVEIPEKIPRHSTDDRFRFLFVGSFDYYPNADGMLYFCREILPLISEQATRPFEVCIVGTGLTRKLMTAFSAAPHVQIVGAVADISPHYFQADAVIIPLRAGGGTRIKVLEAFAHQRAIVSTSVGVEGIAGKHEEHFLLSDTPAGFAENCLRLMNEPSTARRLVSNAYQLVQKKYVFDAMRL